MDAKRLCAVLVGMMAMAGCAPVRLEVPEPLARDAAPLKVEKKYRHLLSTRGTLKAGEYEAAFDEDGATTNRLGVGDAQLCHTEREYRFALASAGRAAPLEVECREQMTGQQVQLAAFHGELTMGTAQNRVSCRVRGGAGQVDLQPAPGSAWVGTERVEGQVTVGAVHLSAESLGYDTQGVASVPYPGFQLLRGGEVVGVVQTQKPLQLWLSPSLRPEEREAAVLGAFSLLLQTTWTFEGPRDCERQA
ncbi:hypothetical protein FGE12_06815 [Aggregicoccus sp. 17bor-14]|uniref:hypothetical protein n=1 Tax=Myxococcaceae TaxID=31 RepID=UPI00129CA5FE|nr:MULTISPECIES: hypothetical protein [Myxococcaceae]MBF5042100.1 hypothetical protein [Simulacricoccus sp. 17bor-14]MRI87877.1 hypothetical protein [Aggregicoccus sp. 17bor-14]